MDFNYKKYSLEKLENWIHDALSCEEASPHEIYSTIFEVVQEQYDYHEKNSQRCLEFMQLLNGHRSVDINLDEKNSKTYEEVIKSGWDMTGDGFWVKDDKVARWVLPVEVDGLTGDCFVQFPDDLLEAANLKEGEQVEWIDHENGSFELRKVNGTK